MKIFTQQNIKKSFNLPDKKNAGLTKMKKLSGLTILNFKQLKKKIPNISLFGITSALHNKCKRKTNSVDDCHVWYNNIGKNYLYNTLEDIVNGDKTNIEVIFAYDDNKDTKSTYSDKFGERYYYRSPYERIHGFLVAEKDSCENPPIDRKNKNKHNINKLSIVCTSPFTDRKAVGTFLIGSFMVLSKIANYPLLILEVANDQMEEDKENKYGKGRDTQKNLFCAYERFGFREMPRIHYNWECFNEDYPYPTMMLDLNNFDYNCISELLIDNLKWFQRSSRYCKPIFTKKKNEVSKICKTKKK
tara:strand:+ start:1372 stop:2277 length:906 start_codon:yes stop_codon:yes gene_type:complete